MNKPRSTRIVSKFLNKPTAKTNARRRRDYLWCRFGAKEQRTRTAAPIPDPFPSSLFLRSGFVWSMSLLLCEPNWWWCWVVVCSVPICPWIDEFDLDCVRFELECLNSICWCWWWFWCESWGFGSVSWKICYECSWYSWWIFIKFIKNFGFWSKKWREKNGNVFLVMCNWIIGIWNLDLDLDHELAFIADDCDDWTNEKMPCGLDL